MITRHPPSQKQTYRINSLTLASIIALLSLTACGEKRSVQCQKIGDILNATSSQRLSASATSQGFSKGAELSRQAADDLMALELGDKKLSNLRWRSPSEGRSHIVASFQDMAEASMAMDAIAGPDGTVIMDANSSAEAEAVMTKFEASSRNFVTKFNALQTYCNGGTVPSELIDAPAQ